MLEDLSNKELLRNRLKWLKRAEQESRETVWETLVWIVGRYEDVLRRRGIQF